MVQDLADWPVIATLDRPYESWTVPRSCSKQPTQVTEIEGGSV